MTRPLSLLSTKDVRDLLVPQCNFNATVADSPSFSKKDATFGIGVAVVSIEDFERDVKDSSEKAISQWVIESTGNETSVAFSLIFDTSSQSLSLFSQETFQQIRVSGQEKPGCAN